MFPDSLERRTVRPSTEHSPRAVDLGNFLGCQPQFADKEDVPQTKFADEEGFSRVPTSTTTNVVLQICYKTKNLLQICRQAKYFGGCATRRTPCGYAPAQPPAIHDQPLTVNSIEPTDLTPCTTRWILSWSSHFARFKNRFL